MREQLRKAGQAIRNFDDAYSSKISDFYVDRFEKSDKSPVDITKVTIGTMLGGGTPSTRLDNIDITPGRDGKINPLEQKIGNALNVVLPVESAVVKYGLPAAGVTLAGKGLLDMSAAFGGQADMPESNQLPLQ